MIFVRFELVFDGNGSNHWYYFAAVGDMFGVVPTSSKRTFKTHPQRTKQLKTVPKQPVHQPKKPPPTHPNPKISQTRPTPPKPRRAPQRHQGLQWQIGVAFVGGSAVAQSHRSAFGRGDGIFGVLGGGLGWFFFIQW